MEECRCTRNKGRLTAGEAVLLGEGYHLRSRSSRCSTDDERDKGYNDEWKSWDGFGDTESMDGLAYQIGLGISYQRKWAF
jgi:hypothetical protein